MDEFLEELTKFYNVKVDLFTQALTEWKERPDYKDATVKYGFAVGFIKGFAAAKQLLPKEKN